ICLPRQENAAVPIAAPQPANLARKGAGTILLAEDEAAVRAITLRILERLGYSVIAAQNAAHCLELAQAARVDLLLTDMIMPDMNGKQLYQRLAVNQPGLRVLYMSGYPGDDGAEDTFLQKP